MNPQPLLPLHSNETSQEASARRRAIDLYHAEPDAEDGLFTAVSKWLTRHPRVISKLGLLSAVLLAIQHMASHSESVRAVDGALINNDNRGGALRHILAGDDGWAVAHEEWRKKCALARTPGTTIGATQFSVLCTKDDGQRYLTKVKRVAPNWSSSKTCTYFKTIDGSGGRDGLKIQFADDHDTFSVENERGTWDNYSKNEGWNIKLLFPEQA